MMPKHFYHKFRRRLLWDDLERIYLDFNNILFNFVGISEVTAMINSKYANPSDDHPDLQFFFGGFLANCARTGQVGEKLDNSTRQIQIIPALLHPKSRGFIKLKDNNPSTHPMIYARYYTHPDDVKIIVEGIKFAIKLSETKGIKLILN